MSTETDQFTQTVRLTYFKGSGKYYSEGEYVTKHKHLWNILPELKAMYPKPGLLGDWRDGPILVVPQADRYSVPHVLFQEQA